MRPTAELKDWFINHDARTVVGRIVNQETEVFKEGTVIYVEDVIGCVSFGDYLIVYNKYAKFFKLFHNEWITFKLWIKNGKQ